MRTTTNFTMTKLFKQGLCSLAILLTILLALPGNAVGQPPANAQPHDSRVYDDLIKRGALPSDFTWNDDGKTQALFLYAHRLTEFSIITVDFTTGENWGFTIVIGAPMYGWWAQFGDNEVIDHGDGSYTAIIKMADFAVEFPGDTSPILSLSKTKRSNIMAIDIVAKITCDMCKRPEEITLKESWRWGKLDTEPVSVISALGKGWVLLDESGHPVSDYRTASGKVLCPGCAQRYKDIIKEKDDVIKGLFG